MKKAVLSFLFVSMYAPLLFAERAVVIGSIKNTKAKEAKYFFNTSNISYTEWKNFIPINTDGNFKIELDIDRIQTVFLQIDEQYTSFYVQPGDSFLINIDYENFDNSIVFSGANSSKNNFNKEFDFNFVYQHEQDVYMQVAFRKPGDFAYYCDSLLNEQLHFADAAKEQLSSEFLLYFKKNLMYESALNKLNYPGLWSYITHQQDSLPEMPSGYFDFVKKLNLDSDSTLMFKTSFECLVAALRHYSEEKKNANQKIVSHEEQMAQAKTHISNTRVLQAYEAFLILNALNYTDFNEAEKNYLAYTEQNKNSAHLNELETAYKKARAISPGQKAPSFTLVNEEGKTCKLEDYAGKVIYLDFWASWCGPCLRELPFSKKIKESFENEDLVFLYISIDEDLESWKNAIVKNNISGIHLSAPGFDHAVCSLYNVSGVPSYFLIDKTGRILNNNPPRPSDGESLTEMLKTALKK